MKHTNEHSLYNNHTLPELKTKPIQLKVVRDIFTEKNTLGKLYVNDKFFAFTCEDKFRNIRGDAKKKVQNATAIDNGTYKVILSQSPRFKRILPELLDVPCFTKIRLHGGNTHLDTEGCILVGAKSNNVDRIWDCKAKVDELVKIIGSNECWITIECANALA